MKLLIVNNLVSGLRDGAIYDFARSFAHDGDEIVIHDPRSVTAVTIDRARFQEVDWAYFISIGRSE